MTALTQAAQYEARTSSDDGIGTLTLRDNTNDVTVSIVPSLGNNSYRMLVKGKDVFWSPYEKLSDFKAKPTLLGNPFLAPWANRLDQHAFFANGKKYVLNPELKNYRADGNQLPIHGLLNFSSHWKLIGPDRREYDFQHRPIYMADDLLTLKYAVVKGTGMSVLPDYMCRRELRLGQLEQVLPGWAPRPGVIHAVFPSRRGLLPAVRRFLDFLGEHVTGEGLSCPE